LKYFLIVLKRRNKNIKIVLDPILTSSSDFDFHKQLPQAVLENNNLFDQVLDKIYLLTPNYREIEKLYADKTIENTIKHISNKTNLFLKGGHRKEKVGKDELYTKTGEYFSLNPKGQNLSEKHGSGCVLSSAIITNLALGFSLLKSCLRGKRYTEKVLRSNSELLGYHNI
jgi:hydroxymethylpyrimidine/phosphomethylpyrimidine kinase